MKHPTEADVLASCLMALKAWGIYSWRSNNVGVYDPSKKRYRSFHGLKGVADILGILPGGKTLCVEVKSATGRLSPEQAAFLDAARAAGALALCVRDVKQLETALRLEGVIPA